MQELGESERLLAQFQSTSEDAETRFLAWMRLAEDAVARSDLPLATECADQAHTAAILACRDELIASALMFEAATLWDRRDLAAARSLYADAAALYRKRLDSNSECLALLRLAWLAHEVGDTDQLFAHLDAAARLEVCEDMQVRLAGNIMEIADRMSNVEKIQEALALLDLTDSIARRIGDEKVLWNCQGTRFWALAVNQRVRDAIALGVELAERAILADSCSRALGIGIPLAELLSSDGRLAEALELCERLARKFAVRGDHDAVEYLGEVTGRLYRALDMC